MSKYDKLINSSTTQAAQCWAASKEQTIWCLNFLQESHVDRAGFDEAQDRLESRFKFLLKWREVRNVLAPLANVLADLNVTALLADLNSPALPDNWRGKGTVYGAVEDALYVAVKHHFGYSLSHNGGPNWGNDGPFWHCDLFDWLLELASAPALPVRD